MHRLLAILFLTVFALSQYAKQLTYLQCKLANNLKATTEHCDCEKQTHSNQTAGKELPATKIHSHISIDEFYTETKTNSNTSQVMLILSSSFSAYADASCKGNYQRLYRPPRIS